MNSPDGNRARAAREETTAHAAQLKSLKKAIRAMYPKLSVELPLMNLAGKVEQID